MHLSEKLELFSQFFIAFLESTIKGEHFVEKVSLMAQLFPNLLTTKNVFTYVHKKSCLWKLFGSERVNESLKLLKFAEKYFYPTFLSVWDNLR